MTKLTEHQYILRSCANCDNCGWCMYSFVNRKKIYWRKSTADYGKYGCTNYCGEHEGEQKVDDVRAYAEGATRTYNNAITPKLCTALTGVNFPKLMQREGFTEKGKRQTYIGLELIKLIIRKMKKTEIEKAKQELQKIQETQAIISKEQERIRVINEALKQIIKEVQDEKR